MLFKAPIKRFVLPFIIYGNLAVSIFKQRRKVNRSKPELTNPVNFIKSVQH